jgi:transcriptional regulator with XRE-family HTH domain
MNFTAIVKERMKELDMNRTELARGMGYSINYISDLLAGQRRWNETTISKACETLKIEIQYVCVDDSQQPRTA